MGNGTESNVIIEYDDANNTGISKQRALLRSIVAVCEIEKGNAIVLNLNLFLSLGFNKSNRIDLLHYVETLFSVMLWIEYIVNLSLDFHSRLPRKFVYVRNFRNFG